MLHQSIMSLSCKKKVAPRPSYFGARCQNGSSEEKLTTNKFFFLYRLVRKKLFFLCNVEYQNSLHSNVWNFCYEGGGGLKIPTIGNLLTSACALVNLEKQYMSWTNNGQIDTGAFQMTAKMVLVSKYGVGESLFFRLSKWSKIFLPKKSRFLTPKS